MQVCVCVCVYIYCLIKVMLLYFFPGAVTVVTSQSNISQTTSEIFDSNSIEDDEVENFIPPLKNNPQIRGS